MARCCIRNIRAAVKTKHAGGTDLVDSIRVIFFPNGTARTISDSVSKLQVILSKLNAPEPSFDEHATASLPRQPEIAALQVAVLDATSELQDLLLKPQDLIVKYGAYNNMASLRAISQFNMTNLVPSGGRISFGEIARQTDLSKDMVRRLLRHAMTMRIFCEPEPGMVAHTRASKALQINHLNAWLGSGSREMWPAAVKLIDAAQKWPDSQETSETAFSLANNTDQSIYDVIRTDLVRAARFAGAMKAFAASPLHDTAHVTENYNWGSLGRSSVVDLGGGKGNVAMAIASRFPELTSITVQDMAEVVAEAEETVPPALAGRVRFMSHDLFSPQTVQADVYYIRWILHNWPDRQAAVILRAQVPALKKGARVIINETCVPEPGSGSLWEERNIRAADLGMGAMFNGRERTVEEWKALLAEADSRFELKRVIQPAFSALAIIEIVWDSWPA